MVNDFNQFSTYCQLCKKYKGKLQKFMSNKAVGLLVKSFTKIHNNINNQNNIIEKLSKDFKMSYNSVLETMVMGQFIQELTESEKNYYIKKNEIN